MSVNRNVLGGAPMSIEQERIYGALKVHEFPGSPESPGQSQGEGGLRRSQRSRNRPSHLIDFGS